MPSKASLYGNSLYPAASNFFSWAALIRMPAALNYWEVATMRKAMMVERLNELLGLTRPLTMRSLDRVNKSQLRETLQRIYRWMDSSTEEKLAETNGKMR
jgi:hypothetical protein